MVTFFGVKKGATILAFGDGLEGPLNKEMQDKYWRKKNPQKVLLICHIFPVSKKVPRSRHLGMD